jgi:hypothetical protein
MLPRPPCSTSLQLISLQLQVSVTSVTPAPAQKEIKATLTGLCRWAQTGPHAPGLSVSPTSQVKHSHAPLHALVYSTSKPPEHSTYACQFTRHAQHTCPHHSLMQSLSRCEALSQEVGSALMLTLQHMHTK